MSLDYDDLAKAIQITSKRTCPPFLQKRFLQSVRDGAPLTSDEIVNQIKLIKEPTDLSRKQFNRLFYETGRSDPAEHWVALGLKLQQIRQDCQIQQTEMARILGYVDNETQWRTEAGRRNLSLFEMWALACSLTDRHDGCLLFDIRMREFWGQSLKAEINRLSESSQREGWDLIHAAKTQLRLRQRLAEQLTSARVLSGLSKKEVSTKYAVSLDSLTQLEAGKLDATVYLCWALSKIYQNYHYPCAVLNEALSRFLGDDLSQSVEGMIVRRKEKEIAGA